MPARLLLFDPYVGGHHADHLGWLARAWHARRIKGELVVAASPALFERHPELRALRGDGDVGHVKFVALRDVEAFARPLPLVNSAARHIQLAQSVITDLGPERLFAMYLDHAQAAFAFPRRRHSTRLSGLLFRPELHLPEPESFRERVRRARKTALLRAMMRARSVEAVFTLDPTAVGALRAIAGRTRVAAVPDPAPISEATGTPGSVRQRYSVEPGRALWTLPGALDTRKGVLAVVDAVVLLPEDAQDRLCIVFAGEAAGGAEADVAAAIERSSSETRAQIVWDRRFLPPGDLQAVIAQADVVLAPYLGHIGSSGVVMRAAAASRPLITQRDGLVGWQTRENGLGRTVDPADTEALTAVFLDALEEPARGFDPERAAAFVAAHTVDAYVDAILGPLGLLENN